MDDCYSNCDCYYLLLAIRKPDSNDGGPDVDEVKQKYKRLILIVHPDKNDDARAHSASILLNQAQLVLSDGMKEKQYRSHGLLFLNYSHTRGETMTSLALLMERLLSTASDDRLQPKFGRQSDHRYGLPSPLLESSKFEEHSVHVPDTSPLHSPTTQQTSQTSEYSEIGHRNHSRDHFNQRQEDAEGEPSSVVRRGSCALFDHRKLAAIIDHNIRPKKVWFIVEWFEGNMRARIEAQTLVQIHSQKLSDYIESIRLSSPRRFTFLMKREPSLRRLLKDDSRC